MRKTVLAIVLSMIGIVQFQNSLAQRKFDNDTELVKAIKSRDINKVKTLIKNGADVNKYSNHFDTPMSVAIKTNQIDMAKVLIEAGANGRFGLSDAANDNNMEMVKFLLANNFKMGYSIIYAAENNNMEMVELLTNHGADLNVSQKRRDGIFKPKYYVTPIEMAVKNNNEEMCLFLINKGVSIVSAIDEGFLKERNGLLKTFIDKSPNLEDNLLKAFKAGNKEIILYCIEKGADKNIKDGQGKTLLLLGAESGDANIVKFCLEDLKLSPHDVSFKGETALMLGAQTGNVALIGYLLQNGVKIEAEDMFGQTALFYSLKSKNENAFHALVQQNADINHVSRNNTTLLIEAADRGQYEIMDYLIENGVSIDTKNNSGQTAYQVVISTFLINNDMAIKLIKKGADIETKSNEGKTLLFLEAEHGHLTNVKYLHSLGASIDTRDESGYRPYARSEEMIRYMIENGADINALNDSRESYLCMAISENNLALAKYLIDKGIDIKLGCDYGESVLIEAIEKKNLEMVKLLVESGADVNSKDHYGKTVLEHALKEGDMQIIQYLSGKGAKTKDQESLEHLKTQSIDDKIKAALKNKDVNTIESLLKENKPATLDKDLSKEIAILGAAKGKLYPVDYAINNLGIKVNDAINLDNQTLLIIAAINNKINSVNYLLDHGADKSHKDYFNKTAWDYATEKTIKEMVK